MAPEPSRRDNGELLGSFYQALSSRRLGYDTLMWQVPALSLSGQAFLFTIALGSASSPAARFIASGLAFILALISMQLMSKHRYHEELNSRLLEKIELTTELSTILGFAPHSPKAMRKEIPVHAGWFTRRSSYRIWMAGLGLFACASLGVVALTALSLVPGMPRWLP